MKRILLTIASSLSTLIAVFGINITQLIESPLAKLSGGNLALS